MEQLEQPDIVIAPIRDETVLERAIIPFAFRELAAMAESICLSQPLEHLVTPEMTDEARVVSTLGAHGLRMAIEIAAGNEIPDEYRADRIGTTDIVLAPELFTHESYPEAVAWAEAFGDALLKEAYLVLGTDVEARLAEFRCATTPGEQLAVIEWLNKRMAQMKESDEVMADSTEGDDESYLLYHPIRLSPKAMGRYPDMLLPPTCLSFSIIAASFLREAGAPMMHAGVMLTDGEEATRDLIYQGKLSAEQIRKQTGNDTSLSDSLRTRSEDYQEALLADHGYHAAVLVQLVDGTWCQVDPNYNATIKFEAGFINARAQTAYDTLHEFASIAPALEIGIPMSANTPLKLHIDQWRSLTGQDLSPYRERIETILLDDDDESVDQRLHECIVDAYVNLYPIQTRRDTVEIESTVDDDGAQFDIETYFRDDFLFIDIETGEKAAYYSQQTHVADAVAYLLATHVWRSQSSATVRERCRQDAAYCARRVEDILAVIPALRATSADTLADLAQGVPSSHTKFEVGRTEPRIGFAVLSDFASYMPNNLPATFWHSTWPSLIPVTERAYDYGGRGSLRAIHNMLGVTAARYLCYEKKYVTIYDAIPPIPERR